MKFSKVQFFHFRNLTNVSVELCPRLNFFIGPNGQGKTNFLEGLYLLTHGTGFRPGRNDVFLQKLENGKISEHARISASVERNSLDFTLQVQVTKPSRKQVLLNNKKASAEDLYRLFPAVIFSPESLSAIKGGPEARRDLVDETLLSVSPRSANLMTQYRRALAQRNRLLRWIRDGERELTSTKDAVRALNDQFLPLAVELTHSRICALREIQPLVEEVMRQISGSDVDVSVSYSITSQSANNWDENSIFDFLKRRMVEMTEAEYAAGSSLVGPHKHDISFLFDGQDSRFYCSQGQQRSLILSYKMAQIMYHQRVHQQQPLLLLDDVMSELDKAKQEYLVGYLKQLESQIVVTTTDYSYPGEFASLEMRTFHVENGNISRG